MLFIYNVLLILFFIVATPFYAVQMLRRRKYRAGLSQRLGFYPASLRARLWRRKCVWVHAVSVGEVIAVMPLLERMMADLPGLEIVLSTVTMTGQEVAKAKLHGRGTVIYFPLDFRVAVNRALRLVSPALIILVETEIWPNFISAASKAAIPLVIVNGRISDRSFKGYMRGRFFLRRLLRGIDLYSMQSELDARRIRAIGAPAERVKVAGNMKFDCGIRPAGDEERREVASSIGLTPDRKVIVAGSTHRGEEEVLLGIYRAAKERHPGTVLVIVPRHPERAGEVRRLVEAGGERCLLRSSMPDGEPVPPYSVLIVDTIGELAGLYNAATLVFVGKSLTGGGGQNIIEPASMGKPVLFGPSMENFREAARVLLENNAAVQVGNARELREAVLALLDNEEECRELGRRASETMARSRGATQRNLNLIRQMLTTV